MINIITAEDENFNCVLAFEFQRDHDLISVGVDCGHNFGTGSDKESWFGLLYLGKEVVKAWELDTEVHENADEGIDRTECIGDVATRKELSEKFTLMFLLRRDLHNQLEPKAPLISYVGIQIRP